MKLKRLFCYCLILTVGLFSSACFSFEQEVFLNADGSGELFLYISMPDLPEEMMKPSDASKKSPADEMAEFKKEMLSGASGTLKLKEAKEIRQNGARGMLAVFQFKDLRDIGAAISRIRRVVTVIRPPRNDSGSSRPSNRLASVTVSSVPVP